MCYIEYTRASVNQYSPFYSTPTYNSHITQGDKWTTHLQFLGVQGCDGAILATWHDVVRRGAVDRLGTTCLLVCKTGTAAITAPLRGNDFSQTNLSSFCRDLCSPCMVSTHPQTYDPKFPENITPNYPNTQPQTVKIPQDIMSKHPKDDPLISR